MTKAETIQGTLNPESGAGCTCSPPESGAGCTCSPPASGAGCTCSPPDRVRAVLAARRNRVRAVLAARRNTDEYELACVCRRFDCFSGAYGSGAATGAARRDGGSSRPAQGSSSADAAAGRPGHLFRRPDRAAGFDGRPRPAASDRHLFGRDRSSRWSASWTTAACCIIRSNSSAPCPPRP